MKKNVLLLTASLFLWTLLPVRVSCETAEEILEKMIAAQGGRSALEKIRDTTLKGTMEMVQMGLGGLLTTYQKEPNMLRMDATVQGTVITQAFDGQTAWMTNPITGMAEKMPDLMARDFGRSALGNDALLDPEKYGISYSLEGKETVEGKVYFALKQIFSDGFKATLLIDPETFLMYKSKTTSINEIGEELEVDTVFSDYRTIEGITLAHSFITYQDGREFMKMSISDVTFNSGLNDSLFKMEEKRPLP
ncbi:MAG: hypothetical protein PVI11_04310 [Candidatus Aminicenantes bacterium]|jgi:outer membrane lipoprotein-sorting protein